MYPWWAPRLWWSNASQRALKCEGTKGDFIYLRRFYARLLTEYALHHEKQVPKVVSYRNNVYVLHSAIPSTFILMTSYSKAAAESPQLCSLFSYLFAIYSTSSEASSKQHVCMHVCSCWPSEPSSKLGPCFHGSAPKKTP